MTVLLVFKDFESVDAEQFLNIYKESSADNAQKWFPELEKAEALKEYENGFLGFMKNDFFSGGGLLFIIADCGCYVSALRLYEKAPAEYYLEALETNPDCRKKGYGREVLLQLQRYLKNHSKSYILTAHVEKTNIPSLKAHKSAGFEITADYVIEDGEKIDTDYQLTFRQDGTGDGSLFQNEKP